MREPLRLPAPRRGKGVATRKWGTPAGQAGCGDVGTGSKWGPGRSSRPTLIMNGNVLELLGILITPTGRMQQIYPARLPKSPRAGVAALALGLAVVALGCRERPTTIDPPPPRPHAGVVLTVAVAD